MSHPTVLSPWFVVQRLRDDGHVEYYQSPDECALNHGDTTFTTKRTFSMLFMSFQSAARVADATAGEVRALFNREHAHEFGRQ